MTGSIQFTSHVAFAPPPTVDFKAQLHHSKVITSEDELKLIAHDHTGGVIGTITLRVDPDGVTGVYCDYGDGHAVVLITFEGDVQTDASLPKEVVVERADLIASHVDPYIPPEGGNPWDCPLTAIVAACELLPTLNPKPRDQSC